MERIALDTGPGVDRPGGREGHGEDLVALDQAVADDRYVDGHRGGAGGQLQRGRRRGVVGPRGGVGGVGIGIGADRYRDPVDVAQRRLRRIGDVHGERHGAVGVGLRVGQRRLGKPDHGGAVLDRDGRPTLRADPVLGARIRDRQRERLVALDLGVREGPNECARIGERGRCRGPAGKLEGRRPAEQIAARVEAPEHQIVRPVLFCGTFGRTHVNQERARQVSAAPQLRMYGLAFVDFDTGVDELHRLGRRPAGHRLCPGDVPFAVAGRDLDQDVFLPQGGGYVDRVGRVLRHQARIIAARAAPRIRLAVARRRLPAHQVVDHRREAGVDRRLPAHREPGGARRRLHAGGRRHVRVEHGDRDRVRGHPAAPAGHGVGDGHGLVVRVVVRVRGHGEDARRRGVGLYSGPRVPSGRAAPQMSERLRRRIAGRRHGPPQNAAGPDAGPRVRAHHVAVRSAFPDAQGARRHLHARDVVVGDAHRHRLRGRHEAVAPDPVGDRGDVLRGVRVLHRGHGHGLLPTPVARRERQVLERGRGVSSYGARRRVPAARREGAVRHPHDVLRRRQSTPGEATQELGNGLHRHVRDRRAVEHHGVGGGAAFVDRERGGFHRHSRSAVVGDGDRDRVGRGDAGVAGHGVGDADRLVVAVDVRNRGDGHGLPGVPVGRGEGQRRRRRRRRRGVAAGRGHRHLRLGPGVQPHPVGAGVAGAQFLQRQRERLHRHARGVVVVHGHRHRGAGLSAVPLQVVVDGHRLVGRVVVLRRGDGHGLPAGRFRFCQPVAGGEGQGRRRHRGRVGLAAGHRHRYGGGGPVAQAHLVGLAGAALRHVQGRRAHLQPRPRRPGPRHPGGIAGAVRRPPTGGAHLGHVLGVVVETGYRVAVAEHHREQVDLSVRAGVDVAPVQPVARLTRLAPAHLVRRIPDPGRKVPGQEQLPVARRQHHVLRRAGPRADARDRHPIAAAGRPVRRDGRDRERVVVAQQVPGARGRAAGRPLGVRRPGVLDVVGRGRRAVDQNAHAAAVGGRQQRRADGIVLRRAAHRAAHPVAARAGSERRHERQRRQLGPGAVGGVKREVADRPMIPPAPNLQPAQPRQLAGDRHPVGLLRAALRGDHHRHRAALAGAHGERRAGGAAGDRRAVHRDRRAALVGGGGDGHARRVGHGRRVAERGGIELRGQLAGGQRQAAQVGVVRRPQTRERDLVLLPGRPVLRGDVNPRRAARAGGFQADREAVAARDAVESFQCGARNPYRIPGVDSGVVMRRPRRDRHGIDIMGHVHRVAVPGGKPRRKERPRGQRQPAQGVIVRLRQALEVHRVGPGRSLVRPGHGDPHDRVAGGGQHDRHGRPAVRPPDALDAVHLDIDAPVVVDRGRRDLHGMDGGFHVRPVGGDAGGERRLERGAGEIREAAVILRDADQIQAAQGGRRLPVDLHDVDSRGAAVPGAHPHQDRGARARAQRDGAAGRAVRDRRAVHRDGGAAEAGGGRDRDARHGVLHLRAVARGGGRERRRQRARGQRQAAQVGDAGLGVGHGDRDRGGCAHAAVAGERIGDPHLLGVAVGVRHAAHGHGARRPPVVMVEGQRSRGDRDGAGVAAGRRHDRRRGGPGVELHRVGGAAGLVDGQGPRRQRIAVRAGAGADVVGLQHGSERRVAARRQATAQIPYTVSVRNGVGERRPVAVGAEPDPTRDLGTLLGVRQHRGGHGHGLRRLPVGPVEGQRAGGGERAGRVVDHRHRAGGPVVQPHRVGAAAALVDVELRRRQHHAVGPGAGVDHRDRGRDQLPPPQETANLRLQVVEVGVHQGDGHGHGLRRLPGGRVEAQRGGGDRHRAPRGAGQGHRQAPGGPLVQP